MGDPPTPCSPHRRVRHPCVSRAPAAGAGFPACADPLCGARPCHRRAAPAACRPNRRRHGHHPRGQAPTAATIPRPCASGPRHCPRSGCDPTLGDRQGPRSGCEPAVGGDPTRRTPRPVAGAASRPGTTGATDRTGTTANPVSTDNPVTRTGARAPASTAAPRLGRGRTRSGPSSRAAPPVVASWPRLARETAGSYLPDVRRLARRQPGVCAGSPASLSRQRLGLGLVGGLSRTGSEPSSSSTRSCSTVNASASRTPMGSPRRLAHSRMRGSGSHPANCDS